jgi:HEAT repeat protein
LVTFFCPSCWEEIPEGVTTCPSCGGDIAAADRVAFREKLRRALWHPEPSTARRAAWILGEQGDDGSVEVLLRRYRDGADPYLGREIAEALAAIGGRRARRALDSMLDDRSAIVRRAVRMLLERWPSESL